MTIKSVAFTLLVGLSTSALAQSAPPPGPPPSGPTQPAPTAPLHSAMTVASIKPTLLKRHVFAIRGTHANGVAGGWTIATEVITNRSTGNVQIKLTATAPAGSRTNRSTEEFQTTVEVTSLETKTGKFDVIVVDKDGKELARTVYEKAAPKA